MRSTSPPATGPGPVELEKPRGSVLEEILCIDGVTDLAVYRMLTDRFDPETEAPPRPQPPKPGEQLGFLMLLPGGAE